MSSTLASASPPYATRTAMKRVMVGFDEMAARMSSPASARAVRRDTREEAMLATVACSALGVFARAGCLAAIR